MPVRIIFKCSHGMFTSLGFRMFKWAGGPRKTFPEVVVVSTSTISNTHTSSNSTKGEGEGGGSVKLIQTKQKRAARGQRKKHKPRTEPRTTPSNQTGRQAGGFPSMKFKANNTLSLNMPLCRHSFDSFGFVYNNNNIV